MPNINPLGKVPVLVLDDDTPLFDSRVIVEYLDNVTPNNKLIPAPSRERTEVKRWEALADGICDAAAAVFLEAKRPPAQQSADWIARQREQDHARPRIHGRRTGREALVHGHAPLAGRRRRRRALGYLGFRFPDIDWQASTPTSAGCTTS